MLVLWSAEDAVEARPECASMLSSAVRFHALTEDDLSCSQVRSVLFPGAIGLPPLFPDPDSLDLW